MNPRFSFAGYVYTVRESPDFSVLVNRIITKRFGAAAARNRQDMHETDYPARQWVGVIDGTTYKITEVEESQTVVALADSADDVRAASQVLRLAQAARDEAVREAFKSGDSASAIAAASGVSVARAYQIRENRR
jgi:hypothetical protein